MAYIQLHYITLHHNFTIHILTKTSDLTPKSPHKHYSVFFRLPKMLHYPKFPLCLKANLTLKEGPRHEFIYHGY